MDLTQDRKKKNFTSSFDTIHGVQEAVNKSMAKYDSHRKFSVASTWLVCFSQRIKFYGDVLDVFVQHHPEYVSLAWGAMKLLFTVCISLSLMTVLHDTAAPAMDITNSIPISCLRRKRKHPFYLAYADFRKHERMQSVVNHEKTTATLARALSEIAETLPRMQLATELYPTEKMKNSLCQLYTHILRFLVRAHDWYKEGTLKHIVHSITRPVELRYDDILQDIAQSSRVIEQLASSGHQAEFRDMHNEIDTSLRHSTQELTEIRSAVSGMSTCFHVRTIP